MSTSSLGPERGPVKGLLSQSIEKDVAELVSGPLTRAAMSAQDPAAKLAWIAETWINRELAECPDAGLAEILAETLAWVRNQYAIPPRPEPPPWPMSAPWTPELGLTAWEALRRTIGFACGPCALQQAMARLVSVYTDRGGHA